MAVEVNSTRKAVEISWDPMVEAGQPEPPEEEKPPGFPTHPIFLPPYVDNTLPPHVDHELPGDQPEIDHELPGDQPEIDHELPGEQPGVSLPIYLPPYVDNTLPGEVQEEVKEKLKAFLTGNLPPSAQPTGGKVTAVQVFAQGQDGDWSNTAVQPNDGLAVLTYPDGFSGESYVEVREALTGALVDSGTITVEA